MSNEQLPLFKKEEGNIDYSVIHARGLLNKLGFPEHFRASIVQCSMFIAH
jgi:hypothetical protein